MLLTAPHDEANGPQGITAGGPTRVAIPSIHVDSQVIPIGSVGRTIQVPKRIDIVGWDYNTQRLPVTVGAVLLVGHRDSASDRDGVFRHLEDVKAGQEILVWTGSMLTKFHVAKVLSYPKQRLPSWVNSSVGPARLVLVSCGGQLRRGADGGLHWDSNVVVVAT